MKISGTFKECYEFLTERLWYFQKLLVDFKMKMLSLLNKQREFFQHKSGDLVYIISPLTSHLERTSSRKVPVKYVEPVVVY